MKMKMKIKMKKELVTEFSSAWTTCSKEFLRAVLQSGSRGVERQPCRKDDGSLWQNRRCVFTSLIPAMYVYKLLISGELRLG